MFRSFISANPFFKKTLGAVTPTVTWTLKDCKGFVVFHITRLVSMFALPIYVCIDFVHFSLAS